MVNHHGVPEDQAWLGLWIEPLDVLFFRDGRPFNASSRADGGCPFRALGGAIRTAILAAIGFNFRRFARRLQDGATVRQALADEQVPQYVVNAHFRGPWLSQLDQQTERPKTLYLSPPANLYRIAGSDEVRRAYPLPFGSEPPGWDPGFPPRQPLWRDPRGKPHPVEEFVTLEGIGEFLAGSVPDHQHHFTHHSRLYEFDHRVGVAIDADSLTSAEGQLFATRMLSLHRDSAFYAEILWNESPAELETVLLDPFPWGGEGRAARARVVSCVDWPGPPPDGSATSVYLLATPGVFQKPGSPGPLDPDLLRQGGSRVIASASTGPLAVSGWDVAQKAPRPTRFAAPAGTVYFAQDSNVPGQSSLCDDDELVAEGWGFALRGVLTNDH